MARTRELDWLEQGLEVLREGGEGALTIERLCQELGRTKGAFYHHFRDMAAYLQALLGHWESKQTSAPIEAANAAAPAARREALGKAVHALDMKLDLAVRAWGLRDAVARSFVLRVDERRVRYLTELMPSVLPSRQRRSLAQLEYTAFLGAQQLFPDMGSRSARAAERLLYRALDALIRADGSSSER